MKLGLSVNKFKKFPHRPDPAIQDQNLVTLIFMMLLYHTWYVGLVVIVVTMIAATATVRYVSVANKYWNGIY